MEINTNAKKIGGGGYHEQITSLPYTAPEACIFIGACTYTADSSITFKVNGTNIFSQAPKAAGNWVGFTIPLAKGDQLTATVSSFSSFYAHAFY